MHNTPDEIRRSSIKDDLEAMRSDIAGTAERKRQSLGLVIISQSEHTIEVGGHRVIER